MSNQLSFTDLEYATRRRTTKREDFLHQMDSVMPWKSWVKMVAPIYPKGERGRPPQPIERMLRMLMLQSWFNLSDEGIEDTIYDSYAMKSFMRIDFSSGEQVPDATTLCKFRKLLNDHGLQKKFFAQVQDVLVEKKMLVIGGTIVDATIVEAPDSTKNKDHQRDPEMKTTRKNNQYYFGMRQHIGVDPVYGFVHSTVATPANANEGKIAPQLLRETDTVVYADAAYLKMERNVTDGIERDYRINRQMGTFERHYGKSLSYSYEKQLEKRKTHVRQKVEYIFHIIKDIFGWRKLRYKGIHKNDCYANLLLASANLYMIYQLERNRKNSTAWA